MSDQVYCSIADLWADLEVQGFEDVPNTLRKIRSASEWIERKLGTFIPITKTIWYDGDGTVHLFIEPILTAPTVVYDGTTLASTDFILYPRSKHWEDGPYTRLAVDPDSSALSVWKRERDVVSVLSSHGKYNKTVATGATVQDDPLAAAGVTMVVDNGGLVSPGDSLLVGSEQILILDYSGSGSDAGKNLNANAAAKDTNARYEGSRSDDSLRRETMGRDAPGRSCIYRRYLRLSDLLDRESDQWDNRRRTC